MSLPLTVLSTAPPHLLTTARLIPPNTLLAFQHLPANLLTSPPPKALNTALLHRLLKALTSLLPTVLNTVQLQVLVPMTQQLTLLNTLPLHQQVHMVQQLTLLLIARLPRLATPPVNPHPLLKALTSLLLIVLSTLQPRAQLTLLATAHRLLRAPLHRLP